MQNRIDPSSKEYLEGLSTNWPEQFAEPARPQPSSSSSWSPSPTWWCSSSWTQKLAEMAPAQVARRQMVRTMVNETTSNLRFQRSRSTASRKLVRPDSSSEVGYSLVSRQENVPVASRKLVREDQLQTDSDEKKHSNSNSTRKLAASSPELRHMECMNHQYMSKIFQFLQMRLGMSASDATFSMHAETTNVLIWRMFMTSPMKAAIHLGPKYLSNREIYKNTKFEEIERPFNITQVGNGGTF